MQFTRNLTFFICISLFVIFSCRKAEKVDRSSSTKLVFSEDTIIFDTVFTTVGSVTQWLTVHNNSKYAVNISSVSILGNTTQFRMNVDGISGRNISNVEIPSGDSIFVFIEATIDPNDDLLPCLITDQIQFITNGNDQRIDLVAYGQNARFYTPTHFPGTIPAYSLVGKTENSPDVVEWDSILPIVIYGYAVVDEFDELIIHEGTKIYFHGGAGLWIYQGGNIKVLGTKEHPVIFQGDRLDAPYNELAGQWDRIWINEGPQGKDNIFNYAIIKNSFIGIQAETLPFDRIEGFSDNFLVLQNTIIEHSAALGILTTNYRIAAYNSLIVNSGVYNLGVSGGGQFHFEHCTFANYWNESTRSTPAIFLTNSYDDVQRQVTVASPIIAADFVNCIIYGNNDNEFDFEKIDESVDLNFKFDHTIVKTEKTAAEGGVYVSTIVNPENTVLFKDPYNNDYHLATGSPAINKGIITDTPNDTDLDQVNRTDGSPDLGAYEYVP